MISLGRILLGLCVAGALIVVSDDKETSCHFYQLDEQTQMGEDNSTLFHLSIRY